MEEFERPVLKSSNLKKYRRFDAEAPVREEGMKLVVPMVALSVLLGATIANAQTARERTIEEIKVEAQARAERGAYPLIGLDPSDVREALSHISTRDRDEWAAGWSAVADRYYKAAEAATSTEYPQARKSV